MSHEFVLNEDGADLEALNCVEKERLEREISLALEELDTMEAQKERVGELIEEYNAPSKNPLCSKGGSDCFWLEMGVYVLLGAIILSYYAYTEWEKVKSFFEIFL